MDDDAAQRSLAEFTAVADHYDDKALAFFARFGEETIARLALPTGARVLDVACGTGHSALAAARVVGPNGHVIGVDLVEPMLDRARAKAEAEHLDNVDLRVGDMRELDFPDASFDAVVSVFGVFFVPDMVALVADLWRLVAPGGSLAVTVWGPDVFEPLRTAFADAVERERPDLPSAGWPLVGADALRTLLLEAGIDESAIEVETLAATHPLLTPDDWWAIVQGTVLHLTVDQLDAEQRDRVRAACDGYATEHNVTEITATVVFGVARKPAL